MCLQVVFVLACVFSISFSNSNNSSMSINYLYPNLNTFTAIVDLSWFNNSCLKSPVLTLVDLIFQSRALHSFSLNQLRDLSLYTGNLYSSFSISSWCYLYPFYSWLCLHRDIMNQCLFCAQRESGLSLAAVYKESSICEVVHVW